MKSLYLDCSAGISGDMIVASLLDAGANETVLMRAMDSIDAGGFSIRISRVKKAGLDCCDFDVVLDEAHDGHDHDMEYLYGHEHHGNTEHDHHDHDHHHEHKHSHHHEHNHHHEHGHHHEHRGLAEIDQIIDKVDATDGAKELAKRIFVILAESEAKAHATTIDNVHFHEVGAIDSIADIVAAAVCFDDLGIKEVIVPRICDGHGSVRCQHGIIPVPVPAVLNIAERYGLPLSITDRQGEYVTPTGAAFVAAVMTDKKLPDVFVPQKTGMGAGKREHEVPGILRAILF